MKILVPLAPGFEEMEAITVIDILRRAKLNIVTAAISENPVKGSHNIKITADTMLNENDKYSAIVLPGGMPGTNNLKDDKRIISLIKSINKSGGITAAICAAPIVLAEAGVLSGKKYTCYPGFEDDIKNAFF
ncbi:MAG: DJ-1 family glyoxalase III, partial [Spirochaetota bacterium]